MMALILSIPLTKKSGAGVVHRADSCDTVWFADSAGSAASVFCMAPLLIISMDTRLLIQESPPIRMASTPPCPIPYISAFGKSSHFFIQNFMAISLPVSSKTAAAKAAYT